jgi:hypothetical protein
MKRNVLLIGLALIMSASITEIKAGETSRIGVPLGPSIVNHLPVPQAGFWRSVKKRIKKGVKIPLNPPGGWKFALPGGWRL